MHVRFGLSQAVHLKVIQVKVEILALPENIKLGLTWTNALAYFCYEEAKICDADAELKRRKIWSQKFKTKRWIKSFENSKQIIVVDAIDNFRTLY